MSKLSVSTFRLPKSDQTLTIIWYNDRMVPKGVKAFFRFDPTRRVVKCRVKVKAGEMITGSQRAEVMQALHEIARRYDYNWESLLSAARSRYP